MVAAVLTFGLIFQQVVFPTLARSWRGTPEEGRKSLDALMRVLAVGMLPVAVGTSVLADPIVRSIFPVEYRSSGLLLAIGIWRAPLLTLAFLYQTALIALNREALGVRILLTGALISGPLAMALMSLFGMAGAAASVPLTAILLGIAGYFCLATENRQPAWHHQLAKPLVACASMVFVCKTLESQHVLLSVFAGATAYLAVLFFIGGLKRSDLLAVIGKS
jgi:O-antigen/teichoic acid export membrane protein